MKLKAIRNFYIQDKVRGGLKKILLDEEFELDLQTEHELISTLVCDLRVIVIDDDIVPPRQKYIVLNGFKYHDALTDTDIEVKRGDLHIFDRSLACRLMAENKIRLADPNAWFPFKPQQAEDLVKTGTIKRMFDEIVEKPKSWIHDWGKKS
jgi:hypothetical protein